jgi:general secretion pathway protein E/type IV pilus assembly protein PilB
MPASLSLNPAGPFFPGDGVEPELETMRIADEVLALVTPEFARHHQLLPLRRDGRTLQVAVLESVENSVIDALQSLTGFVVVPRVAAVAALAAAIAHWYGPQLANSTETSAPEPRDMRADEADHSASSDDAPVIRLVHQIIFEAVQRRASDIHLEPWEKRLRIRYRIDGVMIEADGPAKNLQPAIVSRLKIMANLSIAEKRVPQDGRIQLGMGVRQLDLRVSCLPTVHGESIVMRILDQGGLRIGLKELGLAEDDAATIERLIRLPDGMVLVTGPTGSGKTTTLYSCLHAINQRERKIITVEDPVEYQLSGINQVPVRKEVGMTFAAALRAILRQSPNIIMVGEVRDAETADMAIHGSLTGHLVFSTLHTNDAPGAVTRLIDLGVKPFLLSSALRASVGQRLIRKICENCWRPASPSRVELGVLQLSPEQVAAARFARGVGCQRCQGTGYHGRLGIFEIMVLDDELRRLVHARAGVSVLRAKAHSQGMRSLREDGVRKVIAGLTTIEEVVSLTVAVPT